MERDQGSPDDRAELKFCEKKCAKYFCGCIWLDIVLLVLAIPFLLIVEPIGLIWVALAPGFAILYFSYRYYRDYVTIGQMVVCFFEIILWM
jgi:hypothetical protein